MKKKKPGRRQSPAGRGKTTAGKSTKAAARKSTAARKPAKKAGRKPVPATRKADGAKASGRKDRGKALKKRAVSQKRAVSRKRAASPARRASRAAAGAAGTKRPRRVVAPESPGIAAATPRGKRGLGPEAGGQSGDTEGLSRAELADSESVEELVEEGQAFEAGIVSGVENVPDADKGGIRTRQVPEDDVPQEYLDED